MRTAATSYRMGVPDPETGIRPVNKVVKKVDGAIDYVQLEKRVADSLESFRERWPTEPVEGAPIGDELKVVTSELTDEQLAEIGLTRVAPAEEQVGEIFSSEEAEQRAYDAGIDPRLLPVGEGNGADGKYNTADIRFLVAKAAQQGAQPVGV